MSFNESDDDRYLGIPGTKCITGKGGQLNISYRGTIFPERELWDIAAGIYEKETGRYPRNYDVLKKWIIEDSYRRNKVIKQLNAKTASPEETEIRTLCDELEKQRKTSGKGLSLKEVETKLRRAGCKIDELCDEYIGFIHPCGLYVEVDTAIDEDMFTGKSCKVITSIWC